MAAVTASSKPHGLRAFFARLSASSVAPHQQKSHPFAALSNAYVHTPGKAVWMDRSFAQFAQEGYMRNVITHRCVNLIASSTSHIGWKLQRVKRDGAVVDLRAHPLLSLLQRPNPLQGGAELFEHIVAYYLIGGNAYIQAVGPSGQAPLELHVLRPDRVAVIAGARGVPLGYRYSVGQHHTDFAVDKITGRCRILHLKQFHPLHDWYGLSSVEAAAYSIDQHNQSAAWNQALLQNGARPSGALVVKSTEMGGALSEEQYWRLKSQIEEQFSGAANAGRPLLLEGGLDWKEMSLSPRDMDFIESKNASARDIALALGVPPQLLGIPGDNTFSNMAEARLSLWEQTILPLMDKICDALNNWLVPQFGENLQLKYHTDEVSALTPRRDRVWERVGSATFLTEDEKRTLLGLNPKPKMEA